MIKLTSTCCSPLKICYLLGAIITMVKRCCRSRHGHKKDKEDPSWERNIEKLVMKDVQR